VTVAASKAAMMESRETFMTTPGRTAFLSGRPGAAVNG